MRYVGDIHGKFSKYKQILKLGKPTIAVGDVGIGFRRSSGPFVGELSNNPPYDKMVEGGHRFIRGNHDNPSVCRNHTQCIKDGTVENDIMYVGGALSIDRQWRTEDYDWWPDEELSIRELNTLIDVYASVKPRIMVTHEFPDSIANILFGENGVLKFNFPSRTRQAFDAMFNTAGHQPEIWVGGHWHVSRNTKVNGTRFVCLAELEYKDIE